MEECFYCRIIKSIIPSSIVYSDEKVMAILDAEPVNPGHVEIFPKTHITQLFELDEGTGALMFKIAMRIANALRQSTVKCEGINLLLADGKAASQHILHAHLHVIPRFTGDNFEIRVKSKFGLRRAIRLNKRQLDEIAKELRALLPQNQV
jgi:histidine triad (HIT) family protein